ncbi:MAG: 4Fe-4S binding protein [Oscillospiraceae bacterium]
MIIIKTDNCKGCGLCVSVCRKEALTMSKEMNKKGYQHAVADQEKCIGCGMCYRMCPDCCISITD